ncbi:MAG: hypothetical protein OXC15_05460 [Rhodospirillaceae bacterium]|nr:hypothetical protein [Rhodospirillaceae bacterium]
MRRRRPALLAALAPALAAVLWAAAAGAQAAGPPPSGAGAADPRCDPAVQAALAESAKAGVEADLAIIRHPDQGIRNPDSILDFSCITDLFDYRSFDILFDPAGALDDILDLARRRLCAAARDAYRRYLGRALDASVYTVPARRLPGLDLDWRRRNVLEDVGTRSGDSELFRGVVGGGR